MPQSLKVAIVGSGAREHAICKSIAESHLLREMHVVPGNDAIRQSGLDVSTHLDVDVADLHQIVERIQELAPDLVISCIEDHLAAGIADLVSESGIAVFGPSKDAARLEGSKSFSKDLMHAAGVPTPGHVLTQNKSQALKVAEEFGWRAAIKADGLAAGCGAFVCKTEEESRSAINQLFGGAVKPWISVEKDGGDGVDSSSVIIEQLISGVEVSIMALTDGIKVVALPASHDYKRRNNGDTGPNTGGMGACAPTSRITDQENSQLVSAFIEPIVKELRNRGVCYRGVVYAGVMLTQDGPMVLEYNCRLGNPETQSLLKVIDEDFLELAWLTASGALDRKDPVSANGFATSVCVASSNYPLLQMDKTPFQVHGIDAVNAAPDVECFIGPGAVSRKENEIVLSALGARFLTVTAWSSSSPLEASDRAQTAASRIVVEDATIHYRTDIGARRMLVPMCLLVLLALLFSACGGNSVDSGNKSVSATDPPTDLGVTDSKGRPIRVIDVVVQNSRVEDGPATWTIKRGDLIEIVIKSDSEDEVHLHGYDKSVKVNPDGMNKLKFEAETVGSYELEMHDSGILLGTLRVMP